MTIKFIRRYLECVLCPTCTDRGHEVTCGLCVFTLCRRCGMKWRKAKGGCVDYSHVLKCLHLLTKVYIFVH